VVNISFILTAIIIQIIKYILVIKILNTVLFIIQVLQHIKHFSKIMVPSALFQTGSIFTHKNRNQHFHCFKYI